MPVSMQKAVISLFLQRCKQIQISQVMGVHKNAKIQETRLFDNLRHLTRLPVRLSTGDLPKLVIEGDTV